MKTKKKQWVRGKEDKECVMSQKPSEESVLRKKPEQVLIYTETNIIIKLPPHLT